MDCCTVPGFYLNSCAACRVDSGRAASVDFGSNNGFIIMTAAALALPSVRLICCRL
jgi:hypothetical protein